MRFGTFIALFLFSAAMAKAFPPPPFTGSDDFNAGTMDSSKWVSVTLNGDAALTQTGDGVVRYSTATAANGTAAWLWQVGAAPFSSDWSMQMDVANLRTIGDSQYFNIGIGVRNTANLETQGYSVRLDATDGDPQSIGWETDKETASGTTMDRYNTLTQTGSLLLTWSASTHLLTAAFDENGATGGYVWTAFSTYDPTLAGTWGMTSGDTFTFLLTASSQNANIPTTDGIYADNFSITGTSAFITNVVPEPGTPVLLVAGGGLLAIAGFRRARYARQV